MQLTSKIRKALRLAATQHDGQYRRDNTTPFIIHPVEVALVVSEYTDNEDIISAALLHDVLEDTQGYTYEKLAEEYGNKVADIVQSLTDEPLPELSWNEKHTKYLENLNKGIKLIRYSTKIVPTITVDRSINYDTILGFESLSHMNIVCGSYLKDDLNNRYKLIKSYLYAKKDNS